MSAEEIAWLAGLFDGEGNVAWPRKHNLHTARLSVSNTDFRLLHRVIEVTGTGAIVGKTARKKIEHAPVANWSCYGDRAKRLLALMRPWLIVKAEAADIVLLAAAEKRQREMQL